MVPRMSTDDHKSCFVIAPIGEPDSDIRKRSDQILRYIIRPAAEDCGYETVRADDIDRPGIITNQVIQHILEDALVVADLTGKNPNVFYELAVRHATRKPLVQIIQKDESIPFDVTATRTIFVEHQDLDGAEAAKVAIIDQIKSLETDASGLESPISVPLDLQRLRESQSPEQRSLAEVLSEVSHLSRKLDEALGNAGSSRRPRPVSSRGAQRIRHLVRAVPRKIAFLILLSFFRESVPWIYEIGMEGYRHLEAGEVERAEETAKMLSFVSDFAGDFLYASPQLHELFSELRGAFKDAVRTSEE